ncbi:hypothetical protein TNCT_292421 [Trichonephila clavata]|uniref:Uncharacterized protein n=1 Tax=Trichonephila clavata TaxID=2740835 RepID=A0A8X6K7X3_TRICU|nr:hypothetical protein TNCT_292421 [Trichonephila clavata]
MEIPMALRASTVSQHKPTDLEYVAVASNLIFQVIVSRLTHLTRATPCVFEGISFKFEDGEKNKEKTPKTRRSFDGKRKRWIIMKRK